jgi:3-hydroxyisobutyrate dehydrogenase-like beta-hydroxyacid dehydrogenase
MAELGFIGLGQMGRPMVRRLLERGHRVHVHSRSPGPVGEMVAIGAIAAGSAAEVARRSEIVMTALPTPNDVDQVHGEMLPEARGGQLVIEHSTIRPSHAQRWATAFADRGARHLDAPVSGGPSGAVAGTLTVMVGGDRPAFEDAMPVLQAFGSVIAWCGPSGSGEQVKLVNQLLVAIHALASAEAAAFSVGMGAGLGTTLDLVGKSWGSSTILSRNAPRYVARDFSPASPLRILLKDIRLINEEARELGIRLPLGELVERRLLEGIHAGLGDEDMAALIKLWEADQAQGIR